MLFFFWPHPAAGRRSTQTLRRSATLRAVCFASLATDDLESKFRTALAQRGRVEATALVRQGLVCIDAAIEDGSSPLCRAARDELADGFDIALEQVFYGAPLDGTRTDGLRPRYFAAEAENVAVVDLLVRSGVDSSLPSPPEHFTHGETAKRIALKEVQ